VTEDRQPIGLLVVDQARHVGRAEVHAHERGEWVGADDGPRHTDIIDLERLLDMHLAGLPAARARQRRPIAAE
jgi:hypothetical protein